MLSYRHQNFIFDLREKLDELSYGAHSLSNSAGLTTNEEYFFEQLSRDLAVFGDTRIRHYNVLRCLDEKR